jgi:hypothetical protein
MDKIIPLRFQLRTTPMIYFRSLIQKQEFERLLNWDVNFDLVIVKLYSLNE